MKRHHAGGNLSRRSRVRGGKRSAHTQYRKHGRFAGTSPAKLVWDNTKLALGVEQH